MLCCLLEALSPRPAAHRDPRKSEMSVAPPTIPLGPSRVSGQDSLPPKVLIVLEATVGSTGGAVATVLIPPNPADPRRLMSFVTPCTRIPPPPSPQKGKLSWEYSSPTRTVTVTSLLSSWKAWARRALARLSPTPTPCHAQGWAWISWLGQQGRPAGPLWALERSSAT